jgi:hypothetical protein
LVLNAKPLFLLRSWLSFLLRMLKTLLVRALAGGSGSKRRSALRWSAIIHGRRCAPAAAQADTAAVVQGLPCVLQATEHRERAGEHRLLLPQMSMQ